MTRLLVVLSLIFTLMSCQSDDPPPVDRPAEQETRSEPGPRTSSIDELVMRLPDFITSNAPAQVVSREDPRHIQVSPVMVEGDAAEIVKEKVHRAIVETAIITYTFTDFNEITITSIPRWMDVDEGTWGDYVKEYADTVVTSRKGFMDAVNKLLGVDSIGALTTVEEVGGMPITTFSDLASRITHNGQGAPGVDVFVEHIAE